MKGNILVTKVLILFFLPALVLAQPRGANSRFEVEADPIAFLLSGYSFHVGRTFNHIRVDIGTFGIKQPDFALANDKFSVFSTGTGAKLDYILKEDKGLFFGLQSDYVTDRISLKTGSSTEKAQGITVGLRTGYRFMFGTSKIHRRGLYLVPWVALLRQSNTEAVQLEGHTYQPSSWSVFPTVHLGYRF